MNPTPDPRAHHVMRAGDTDAPAPPRNPTGRDVAAALISTVIIGAFTVLAMAAATTFGPWIGGGVAALGMVLAGVIGAYSR